MKRIEFTAPVEAMRGNLSGRQKLVYAKNDNPAFSAPEGVNYARNYKPRFIGAKKAKNGMTYFATRTKHAAVNNRRTQAAQGALAAGRAAYYVAMKDLSVVSNLMALFGVSSAKANGESMYKWFVDKAIAGYRQMVPSFSFSGKVGSSTILVTLDNIFRKGTSGNPCKLPSDILQKFWKALSLNGITFDIDGQTGIAFNGDTFADILADTSLNVLGLAGEQISNVTYVKLDSLYLLEVSKSDPTATEYVVSTDTISSVDDPDFMYALTDVAPSA